jgi:hypothetical protein
MLAFSAPPGYQRKKPVARPKLGPWLGVMDSPNTPALHLNCPSHPRIHVH